MDELHIHWRNSNILLYLDYLSTLHNFLFFQYKYHLMLINKLRYIECKIPFPQKCIKCIIHALLNNWEAHCQPWKIHLYIYYIFQFQLCFPIRCIDQSFSSHRNCRSLTNNLLCIWCKLWAILIYSRFRCNCHSLSNFLIRKKSPPHKKNIYLDM